MNAFVRLGDLRLALHESGPEDGPALVLAHGLGMDMRIWEAMLPHLPETLRVIRYDARGHGESDCPAPPYAMGALVRDAEMLLERLDVKGCVFLGLGMGGMVAQGLAVKRLDLVHGLILSNTTTRSGPAEPWQARAEMAMQSGMLAVVDDVLRRWNLKGETAGASAMLRAQCPQGYAGCCAAIAGTDFFTTTSGLRLPTLGIAGSDDRAIPPDMVRETCNLIPGARIDVIRRAGHLPCMEQPKAFAQAVTRFLGEIGQL